MIDAIRLELLGHVTDDTPIPCILHKEGMVWLTPAQIHHYGELLQVHGSCFSNVFSQTLTVKLYQSYRDLELAYDTNPPARPEHPDALLR